MSTLMRVSSYPQEDCRICMNLLSEPQVVGDHVIGHTQKGDALLTKISLLLFPKFIHFTHESCGENWRTVDTNQALVDFQCPGGCEERFLNQPPSRIPPTLLKRLLNEALPITGAILKSQTFALIATGSALISLNKHGSETAAVLGAATGALIGARFLWISSIVLTMVGQIHAEGNGNLAMEDRAIAGFGAICGAISGGALGAVTVPGKMLSALTVGIGLGRAVNRQSRRVILLSGAALPIIAGIFTQALGGGLTTYVATGCLSLAGAYIGNQILFVNR